MSSSRRSPALVYSALVAFAAALALWALPAIAGTSAASAATPKKSGLYVATTSQGLPARFKVTRTGRWVIGTMWERLRSPEGSTLVGSNEPFRARISSQGRIGGAYGHGSDVPDDPSVGEGDLTASVTHDLTARFSRPSAAGIWRRLSGVWHTHAIIRDGSGAPVFEFDTGAVRFTARLTR